MNITIEIQGDMIDIKKAIAKGRNKRFGENLTHKDISLSCVSNKDDILNAIPYLDSDRIEILNIE